MSDTTFVFEVDDREVSAALGHASAELTRVMRNSLNDTARSFQKAERAHILQTFDVRQRSFILNTVYFPKQNNATKERLAAEVEINPARDHLAKFEAGGRKVALGGAKYVALPGKEIKTRGGHVTPRYRLDKLKPFRPVGVIRGRRETLVGEKGTFFIRLKRGRSAGRPALMLPGTKRRRPKLLWLFVPSVQIDPDLQFEKVGQRVGEQVLPIHLVQAIAHAFRRSGLLG